MELLDVLDENGNLTGRAEERKIVHEQGLMAYTCWCMDNESKRRITIPKRSPNKIINQTNGHEQEDTLTAEKHQ